MDDRDPRQPSVVEDLLGRTRHFLSGMVADYLQRSLEDILRWILGRSLRYAVSAGFFILASAFLFLAAFEGLLVAGVPRYAAHLIVGAAALLAGLLCLRPFACPPGRK
jgi:hypothetical protein